MDRGAWKAPVFSIKPRKNHSGDIRACADNFAERPKQVPFERLLFEVQFQY